MSRVLLSKNDSLSLLIRGFCYTLVASYSEHLLSDLGVTPIVRGDILRVLRFMCVLGNFRASHRK